MDQATVDIYCDGGARGNPGPAASAFVVKNQSGQVVFQRGFFLGTTTNNQAEYHAVAAALDWLRHQPQITRAQFFLDSQLVVNQLRGVYKIKDRILQQKSAVIKKMMGEMAQKNINFSFINRGKNFLADRLVNQTLDRV